MLFCPRAQHFNNPAHQAHFDVSARLAGAQHRLVEMEQSEFRLRAWEIIQARYAAAASAPVPRVEPDRSFSLQRDESTPMDIDVPATSSLRSLIARRPLPPAPLFSESSLVGVETATTLPMPAPIELLQPPLQPSWPVAVSARRKRVAPHPSCCLSVELSPKRVHHTLTPLPASHPALVHCALRAAGRRCARLKQERGLLLTWARAFAPTPLHPALANVAFSARRIQRQQQQEERLLKWARAYVAPPAAPLVGVELNPGPAASAASCKSSSSDVNLQKQPRSSSSAPSSIAIGFNSLPRFLVHCVIDFLPTTSIVRDVAPLSRRFHFACLDYAATVGSMATQRRDLRAQLAELKNKLISHEVDSSMTSSATAVMPVDGLLTNADRVALMLRAGRMTSNNPKLTLRELTERVAQQLARLYQLPSPTMEDKAAASHLCKQLELLDAQEAQILSGSPSLLALLPTAWCDCPFGRTPTRPNFTATERAAQLSEPRGAFGLLGFHYMQASYRVAALHYHAQVRLAQQSTQHLVIDRSMWEDVLEHHSTILHFHTADHSSAAAAGSTPAFVHRSSSLPSMAVRMQLGLRIGVDSALLLRLRTPQLGSTDCDRLVKLQRMVTCRLRLVACSELQALADGYEAGEGDPTSTPTPGAQTSLSVAEAYLDYHIWGRMAVAEARRMVAAFVPAAPLVGVELNPGPADSILHNSWRPLSRSHCGPPIAAHSAAFLFQPYRSATGALLPLAATLDRNAVMWDRMLQKVTSRASRVMLAQRARRLLARPSSLSLPCPLPPHHRTRRRTPPDTPLLEPEVDLVDTNASDFNFDLNSLVVRKEQPTMEWNQLSPQSRSVHTHTHTHMPTYIQVEPTPLGCVPLSFE